MENEKNSGRLIAYVYMVLCMFMALGMIVYVLSAKGGLSNNRPSLLATDTTSVANSENTASVDYSDSTPMNIGHPDKDIDWESLQNVNSDVYAWIYVPNTQINYPVYQSANSDIDYYLSHNADGSEGYPGCVYSHSIYNSKDFTDRNTILYGHNMKNGTMFAGIHDFREKAFFNDNSYMYVYLPNGKVMTYQIFGCYSSDDDLLPYVYDFSTDAGFVEYLQSIRTTNTIVSRKNDALLDTLNVDSKLLTLSTCFTHNNGTRLLLQGVLIEEYDPAGGEIDFAGTD